MNDINKILGSEMKGDVEKIEALFPLVYDELRKLAKSHMARESFNHTLQPTALVHEAWLRMVDDQEQTWQNRSYFFAAATTAMRRILVEHARAKMRKKRGGNQQRIDIDVVDLAVIAPDEKILQVDAALNHFEIEHPEEARMVMLKYFGGMTNKEVADLLGISERSVDRRWVYAKAWLLKRIRSEM